ncbi:MAG: von Willebrand factor type A domain-containing protein, partial [Planctomycetota bacterium]
MNATRNRDSHSLQLGVAGLTVTSLFLLGACQHADEAQEPAPTTEVAPAAEEVEMDFETMGLRRARQSARPKLQAPALQGGRDLAGGFSTQTLLSSYDRELNPGHNTESYDHIVESSFLLANANPLSTFSVDVDTASYSNLRRFLNSGTMPPPGSVRIEEMINYFGYDYPQPKGSAPFSRKVELGPCPWNQEHQLLHIGLQGRRIDPE